MDTYDFSEEIYPRYTGKDPSYVGSILSFEHDLDNLKDDDTPKEDSHKPYGSYFKSDIYPIKPSRGGTYTDTVSDSGYGSISYAEPTGKGTSASTISGYDAQPIKKNTLRPSSNPRYGEETRNEEKHTCPGCLSNFESKASLYSHRDSFLNTKCSITAIAGNTSSVGSDVPQPSPSAEWEDFALVPKANAYSSLYQVTHKQSSLRSTLQPLYKWARSPLPTLFEKDETNDPEQDDEVRATAHLEGQCIGHQFWDPSDVNVDRLAYLADLADRVTSDDKMKMRRVSNSGSLSSWLDGTYNFGDRLLGGGNYINLEASDCNRIFPSLEKASYDSSVEGIRAHGRPSKKRHRVSPGVHESRRTCSQGSLDNSSVESYTIPPHTDSTSDEDRLDTDSDCFTWTDYSESTHEWDPSGSILAPIRREYVSQLIWTFDVRRHGQRTHVTTKTSRASASSESTSGKAPSDSSKESGKRPAKRKRDEPGDGEGGGNGGNDGRRRPSVPTTDIPEQDDCLLLACPFAKWNPRRYRKCYSHILKDVSRVKYHLLRSKHHQIPIYCPRCSETFESEAIRDGHVRLGTCPTQPQVDWEGISSSQRKELSKKVSSKNSVRENWNIIYKILFPDSPLPNNPYIENSLSEELCAFRDHEQSEGPVIWDELINSFLPDNLRSHQEQIRSFCHAMYPEAVERIYERWRSRNPSSSPSRDYSQSRVGSSNLSRYDESVAETSRNAAIDASKLLARPDSGLGGSIDGSMQNSRIPTPFPLQQPLSSDPSLPLPSHTPPTPFPSSLGLIPEEPPALVSETSNYGSSSGHEFSFQQSAPVFDGPLPGFQGEGGSLVSWQGRAFDWDSLLSDL